VFGQRRVGKTFLLQHHLAKYHGSIYFLAEETTSTALLTRFRDELAVAGGLPSGVSAGDWSTTFTLLCQTAAFARRPLHLVLDEVQYLLEAEPGFPSMLQRIQTS